MSEIPVTVLATITVKPGFEERARVLLHSIVAPTLDEPGCLAYELHQSVDSPTEFLFHERWASDAALAAHAASTAPHRARLRQQLGDFITGPPNLTRWRRVE